MGLLHKFGNFLSSLERRWSTTQSLLVDGGEVRWSGKDYENYAKEAYLKNVIAYRCIVEIAFAASSVDYLLMKKSDRGKMIGVEEHPLLDLLERPNPDDYSFDFFLFKLVAFLGLTGNSYGEKVSLLTGQDRYPKELYVLRPDRMKVLVNTDTGVRKGYEYQVGGRKRVFQTDPITGRGDILHLKMLNPIDDWYGAAPTETAARDIDTHNEATTWNMRLLQNQARPGMLYLFEQTLSDKQYDRITEEMKKLHGGGMSAGKTLILDGKGVKVQPYGFTPAEMDFIEGNREKARMISLAWGVPPMLLGIPGDNTYSNYEQARLAFWENTALFYVRMVAGGLSSWLIEPKESMSFVPDLDSVPALEPRRKETWEKAKGADWLTINEKRTMTGYDEVGEEGDVILVSASVVTLEQAVEPPEPVPVPLAGGIDDGGGGEDGSMPMGDEDEEPKKPPKKKPKEEE